MRLNCPTLPSPNYNTSQRPTYPSPLSSLIPPKPFPVFTSCSPWTSAVSLSLGTREEMRPEFWSTGKLQCWSAPGPVCRHGICHGCTDIIHVKFIITGVKCIYEHTLFVVNSLPVAFLCCFGDLFRCFIRKRFYNRWVFLVKSGQFKKNVSCDKTLLFSCPEQL